MHKETEVKEVQIDRYLIGSVECDEFKGAVIYEECQKATSKCKPMPNSREFRFWHLEFKCVEMSKLEIQQVDLFILCELLGGKLYPLVESLIFLEKLRAFIYATN